jgi:hypothetical protein
MEENHSSENPIRLLKKNGPFLILMPNPPEGIQSSTLSSISYKSEDEKPLCGYHFLHDEISRLRWAGKRSVFSVFTAFSKP